MLASHNITASFDAAVFFKGLRDTGLNPIVADGRLIFDAPNSDDERQTELFGWAARNDIGGLAQRDYVRER